MDVLCKEDSPAYEVVGHELSDLNKKNQTPQLLPLERTSPNLSQLKVALLATQGQE